MNAYMDYLGNMAGNLFARDSALASMSDSILNSVAQSGANPLVNQLNNQYLSSITPNQPYYPSNIGMNLSGAILQPTQQPISYWDNVVAQPQPIVQPQPIIQPVVVPVAQPVQIPVQAPATPVIVADVPAIVNDNTTSAATVPIGIIDPKPPLVDDTASDSNIGGLRTLGDGGLTLPPGLQGKGGPPGQVKKYFEEWRHKWEEQAHKSQDQAHKSKEQAHKAQEQHHDGGDHGGGDHGGGHGEGHDH